MNLFKNKKENNLNDENKRIKVLGSGCRNCMTLENNAKEALKKLGKNIEIGHVKDFAKIGEYGVLTTPALVIDEKLVSQGKVLSKEELIDILGSIDE